MREVCAPLAEKAHPAKGHESRKCDCDFSIAICLHFPFRHVEPSAKKRHLQKVHLQKVMEDKNVNERWP